MLSRLPSRPAERQALLGFAACALALALTWLLGISLRTPIWTDNVRKLTDPGMSLSFPRISGMMSTALIVALASAFYVGALWALRRGFPRAWTAAILASILAALAWLPSTTLSSPDAVHLAADVRTFWLHGKFPASWGGRPSQVDDPVAEAVVRYQDRPSGYGPVAYAIGGAPLPFVGDSVRLNLLGQKIVSATFLVLAAVMAGWLARWFGHNAALATGIVGLNPMMLWQFPGDAHNDSIMAALGLLAVPFLLSTSWRKRAGGAGIALASVLAKFGLALAGPIVIAYWFPRWRAWVAAAMLLAGLGLAALIGAGEGFGLGTIGPATAIAPITPWDILWRAADRDPEARRWIALLSYILFALVMAAIIWKHPLETARDAVTAAATALFLFLFVCSPGFLPWYQMWYLPLVAASGKRWLVITAVGFSIASFVPLFAYNWQIQIASQMDITDAPAKAVAVVWISTGVAALVLYRADLGRALRTGPAAARGNRRAVPRKAIRARR